MHLATLDQDLLEASRRLGVPILQVA